MSYRRKTTAAEDRAMSGSTITVLSAWMAIVSAINIQLIPENPVIQSSVTLNVTGIIGKILTILWCKGPNTNSENHILTYLANDDSPIIVGDKYFTRVQAFSNGSLAITNLSVHDGGQYMVKIQTQIAPDQASIDFRVYEPVSKPIITASPSQVQESDAVNLTCSAVNADQIIWKKDGSILPDDIRLSADNTTIEFSSVNNTDAGNYQCEARNIASQSTSDLYTLTVPYGSECSTCGTNTAAISGVACAAVLIIAILLSICFLLYKKCVHPVHDIPRSPYEREDPCVIYDNVLELTPARNIQPYSTQRSKEEPAYMVLQYASESHYNEINR
ncbi:cell adhesion molecule CEACAM1-like isoform X2 [Aquarana catesbeiana]|uniref:cell adhesion molecule CEACAM1-like isoform X2 n=1 Tax=Aquarana catesbeiana TaxID=8400 RepID=UPI003CCA069A